MHLAAGNDKQLSIDSSKQWKETLISLAHSLVKYWFWSCTNLQMAIWHLRSHCLVEWIISSLWPEKMAEKCLNIFLHSAVEYSILLPFFFNHLQIQFCQNKFNNIFMPFLSHEQFLLVFGSSVLNFFHYNLVPFCPVDLTLILNWHLDFQK